MKLELEEECWACGGDGIDLERDKNGNKKRCHRCGGTGKTITQDGEIILDFLRRNIDKLNITIPPAL